MTLKKVTTVAFSHANECSTVLVTWLLLHTGYIDKNADIVPFPL